MQSPFVKHLLLPCENNSTKVCFTHFHVFTIITSAFCTKKNVYVTLLVGTRLTNSDSNYRIGWMKNVDVTTQFLAMTRAQTTDT